MIEIPFWCLLVLAMVAGLGIGYIAQDLWGRR